MFFPRFYTILFSEVIRIPFQLELQYPNSFRKLNSYLKRNLCLGIIIVLFVSQIVTKNRQRRYCRNYRCFRCVSFRFSKNPTAKSTIGTKWRTNVPFHVSWNYLESNAWSILLSESTQFLTNVL